MGKSIRFTFLSLAMLFSSFSLLSQEFALSGKIVSSDGEPIPFANVVLLSPEAEVIKGAISEENGSFAFNEVPAGSYKIRASFVGFTEYNSPVFSVSSDKVLDDISLEENAESLDEVTVTAKKPVIRREADRIVFNVENSIISSGSTWDILKSTPGVVEKQGSLTVRNQGIQVYLNDRKVELTDFELKGLLEGLGGETIKEIEVIMNPPARYDAEGGPILNIISSQSKFEGYKGSITARGTYGIFPKHYFGTSHFLKGKKVNLFFNYSYNPLKLSHQSDNFINYFNPQGGRDRWVQDFERITNTNAHNANLILDYQVSEKHSLSLSVLGLYSPNEVSANTNRTIVTPAIDDPFGINTNSGIDSEKTNLAIDLQYKITLKKGALSSNLHHTRYNREVAQSLNSDYTDAQGASFSTVRFNSDAIQDIEIYTGGLDYTTTLGSVNFETGAKFSIIDSRSTINFTDIQNDFQNGLSEASNDDFLYDENVFAGYVSFAKDWKKWSAKAGLRAEQTESLGNSLVLNQQVDLNYFEWFPSAFVQYQASENHSWSLDYGRKLDRPRYQDLNPFASFLNENNFNTGNPNLLPSFSNNFNLNYSLKNSYFFDIYFRDNGENILTLPFQDNVNQVLRTERQNALGSKSWGFDFQHARSITKWWYFYTYISIFHEEETFRAVESDNVEYTNEVDGVYLSAYNSFTLSKDKTWTAEASVGYFSNFISASYIQDPTTNVTLGLKKSFWKERATLTVTASDVLGEANALLTSRYLNQDNAYFAVPETQNLRIGFTYNFGNFKLEDNERSIDKNEIDRID